MLVVSLLCLLFGRALTVAALHLRSREFLIAQGLSNIEIGRELYISDTTVKSHVTRILQKLELRDRVQAVVLAYRTGLFEHNDS